MGSRTWIKIYCNKWLNGTIREESLEVRAVWVDLLVLAGSGKYGDSGEVKITDEIGFLDQQLADLLQISTRKWKIISKRLQETDRICLHKNNVIVIKNWGKYQSEYERQKEQRIRDRIIKGADESATNSADESATREGEGEGDKRIENRDTPLSPPIAVADNTKFESLYELLNTVSGFPPASNGNIGKLQEIIDDYPGLNYKLEFKKFREYWNARQLKRPWLALRNWLDKTRRDMDAKAKGRGLPKTYTPSPNDDI